MANVIMSCFAGRKRYMEILCKYVDVLLERKLIDEFHIWNYTRNDEDELWIKNELSRFKIFNPEKKSEWSEYYSHYTRARYPAEDFVLIKCDDDIVFIDVEQFQSFIDERRRLKDALLLYPGIVNNTNPNIFQEKILGLFPGFNFTTSNIRNGRFCMKIHNYFLDNLSDFLSMSRMGNHTIRIHHETILTNINFFAINGRDLEIFELVGPEDEISLSSELPKTLNRYNYINIGFVVSHMAFYSQRDHNYNEAIILQKYRDSASLA